MFTNYQELVYKINIFLIPASRAGAVPGPVVNEELPRDRKLLHHVFLFTKDG
jgi:hypothetical protein